MKQIANFFKNVGASAETLDIVIPAGEAFVITSIDFTIATSGAAGSLKVEKDPTGTPTILAASSTDKFIHVDNGLVTIEGPETVRLTLSKAGGGPAALMGIVMYYEHLGA